MKTKFKKIINNIKNYILENYISILILIILVPFCLYDTGYGIYKPGGIINSTERVTGTSTYESKGTFNMAYVGYMKARLPYYLLAKIIPDWELVKNEDLTISDNETINDTIKRDHLQFNKSISDATKVAFDTAGVDYQITKSNNYIYYKGPQSTSNIKVGDELIKVDNKKITNLDELKKYIQTKNTNDKVHLTYIENEETKEEDVTIYEEKGEKYIGISFITINEYSSKYNLKIKSKENESGPSGGLITTLSIYDAITKEDLTKGKKIVGTGTIDSEGNVGEIGSVTYKIAAANKEKADIFLCPKENYEEALNYAKKHNYKIKIKSVSTFKEAIDYLKTI